MGPRLAHCLRDREDPDDDDDDDVGSQRASAPSSFHQLLPRSAPCSMLAAEPAEGEHGLEATDESVNEAMGDPSIATDTLHPHHMTAPASMLPAEHAESHHGLETQDATVNEAMADPAIATDTLHPYEESQTGIPAATDPGRGMLTTASLTDDERAQLEHELQVAQLKLEAKQLPLRSRLDA